MTKFESGVKVVPASQEAVYEKLSDLSNLEKVKDRLPEDKVKNLSFDAESMTIEVAPIGKLRCRLWRRSLASVSSLQQPLHRCPSICGYRLYPSPKPNVK